MPFKTAFGILLLMANHNRTTPRIEPTTQASVPITTLDESTIGTELTTQLSVPITALDESTINTLQVDVSTILPQESSTTELTTTSSDGTTTSMTSITPIRSNGLIETLNQIYAGLWMLVAFGVITCVIFILSMVQCKVRHAVWIKLEEVEEIDEIELRDY